MKIDAVRKTALSGARWTLTARVGLQLITWPATIIVIRFLEPSDYGLFAIALLFTAFIALFAELGLGVALVQTREIDDGMARAASTLVLMLNGIMALAIAAIAPWVAWFYDQPDVALIMRVLTIELLIAAFAAVPQAMLERQLQFRELSLAQIAGGIAGAAVTLVAALLGAGVWALVTGNLTITLVRSAMLIAFYGRLVYPGKVSRVRIRPLVHVSTHVLAGRALWYWYGQADQFVLGKLLNAGQFGFYAVAAQLALLPGGKMMEVVNRVSFPILSRLQSDRPALRDIHLRLVAFLAMYGFGVCWGLAAVAHELVELVFGPKWGPAATPLALLAITAPLRMLSSLNNTTTVATGTPGAATKELLLAGVLVPVAVAAGAWWHGLLGASMAWLFSYPIVYLVSNRLTCASIGADIRAGLKPLAVPFIAGCAMLAAVWLVRGAIGTDAPIVLLLGAEIAVGGAVYAATMWLLAKALVLEAKTIVRDMLRPSASSANAPS